MLMFLYIRYVNRFKCQVALCTLLVLHKGRLAKSVEKHQLLEKTPSTFIKHDFFASI